MTLWSMDGAYQHQYVSGKSTRLKFNVLSSLICSISTTFFYFIFLYIFEHFDIPIIKCREKYLCIHYTIVFHGNEVRLDHQSDYKRPSSFGIHIFHKLNVQYISIHSENKRGTYPSAVTQTAVLGRAVRLHAAGVHHDTTTTCQIFKHEKLP